MTIEDSLSIVINILNEFNQIRQSNGFIGPEAHEYLFWQYIKEALEKQIAKKPKVNENGCLDCPNCGWTFCFNKENISVLIKAGMQFKCCPEYGQKINWSEYND